MADLCVIDSRRIAEGLNRPGGRILLGIDGFIDEVWQIIESRANRKEYALFDRMLDFSEALVKCYEGGFSQEIVRKRRSYGGFTANTSRAVSRLGAPITILGMFGGSGIDPVFEAFAEAGELISVGEPGLCQVYEFTDGKLMLPYIQEVMDFSWENLTNAVDEGELKKLFTGSDIIALGYWSLMPAFDEIVEKVCGLVRGGAGPRRMFFDFADIRKRDRQSLENTLERLEALGSQMPMTLSLNEHEAAILFSYYGEDLAQEAAGADERTERVRNRIGLDELVVHSPYFAAAASASEGSCVLEQDYCKAPIITTGAGDNFNGGYLVAHLKGLGMAERLAVANAVTYLYVSTGRSPDKETTLAYIMRE